MITRLLAPALLLASLLAACGGSRCPEGTYRNGGRCVPWRSDSGQPPLVDAGRDAAPPLDAAIDAAAIDAATDAAIDAAIDDAGEGGVVDAGPGDAGDPCSECPAERPLCDEALGRCVECTADDDSRCGDRSCDVGAGACRASLCEACTADAQCGTGRACVMEEAGDVARCVWREDAAAGPAGSCLENGRPFVEPHDAISVDGASVRVCLLGPSTCAAWLVYRSPVACASDADCGLGAGDGSCVDGDPGPATVLRCTMACVTDVDCPIGATCDRDAGVCSL